MLKPFSVIKTSPRISIRAGILSPYKRKGMALMVLTFSVIFSPVVPSPRVAACTKRPFSYSRLTASPSNFNSQQKVISSLFSDVHVNVYQMLNRLFHQKHYLKRALEFHA